MKRRTKKKLVKRGNHYHYCDWYIEKAKYDILSKIYDNDYHYKYYTLWPVRQLRYDEH